MNLMGSIVPYPLECPQQGACACYVEEFPYIQESRRGPFAAPGRKGYPGNAECLPLGVFWHVPYYSKGRIPYPQQGGRPL